MKWLSDYYKTLQPSIREFRLSFYLLNRNALQRISLIVIGLLVLIAIFAPWIAPFPSHAISETNPQDKLLPPSSRYWFGTDELGRDLLSRVIFGTRISLQTALIAVGLALLIGVPLGAIAGGLGGAADEIIMRITDVFLSFPPLLLAIAIAAFLGPSLQNAMLAIAISWWPWYTRLVYGLATQLRNEYFVVAAEVNGASTWHILFREILPNTISPILTKMSLDVAWVIIIGSMLSFVGLGVQPPEPSLGTMVADGARYLPDQWWIAVFPALAIVVVVLGFNLLGDGVRDMFAAEGS